jgi:hypothetical protein
LRERNENRNNDNRLFDSQNNAKGGYPWPGNATWTVADPLTLYVGSVLHVEWTLQHSCGPDSNAWCNVILQYMCNDTNPYIRDGYPTGVIAMSDTTQNNGEYDAYGYWLRTFVSQGQNQDGTNTIPCPSNLPTNVGCPGPNFGTSLDSGPMASLESFYSGQAVTSTQSGTTTTETYVGQEFGYHETWDYYYYHCLYTHRNKGIYTADQTLQGENRRFTRQNPNGDRYGLECQEERDYYPFWGVSQWKDVAVFVSNVTWCAYFQANSQNNSPRYYCNVTDFTTLTNAADGLIPIDSGNCGQVGNWVQYPSWGLNAPDCIIHPISRDNHLGNANIASNDGTSFDGTSPRPETASYLFTVPADWENKQCVLRVRYNMSNDNYPSVNSFTLTSNGQTISDFIDWKENCPRITQGNNGVDDNAITVTANLQCSYLLTAVSRPLYNRPYVDIFYGTSYYGQYSNLSLAINTNQVSRTFQDRSYILQGVTAPASPTCGAMYNLNIRGRRGNIVQCYPAVEYDFTPTWLSMTKGDCVHIQWIGSDFEQNNNPNDGEGWRFSDRWNMVQTATQHTDIPNTATTVTMFPDLPTILKFAFPTIWNWTACYPFKNGDTNEDNSINNCGKMNPQQNHVDFGNVQFNPGTYYYVSTRTNNFSNRSTKGVIVVNTPGLSAGAIAGITVAAVLVGAVGIGSGVYCYAKKRPSSALAKRLRMGQ